MRSLPAHFKLPLLLFLSACGSPNTPLDPITRRAIDSISTAEINRSRAELDTLCLQQHSTQMPLLVDSIKQRRLREIEEQLKTVPR